MDRTQELLSALPGKERTCLQELLGRDSNPLWNLLKQEVERRLNLILNQWVHLEGSELTKAQGKAQAFKEMLEMPRALEETLKTAAQNRLRSRE